MDSQQQISNNVKATVVIMTYNRKNTIVRAIESVFNQTLKEWKLLILDDASTDGTDIIVKPYVLGDQRIMYYRLPTNKGICHVLNEALNIVDTPYMVQLDSDDWLENKALETLVKSMENAPSSVALVYGNHQTWYNRNKGTLKKQRSFTHADKYELLVYGSTLYPRCYKTNYLKAVGGWETNDKYNGRYMEDNRIFYKLIEKYDFHWIDEHMYNLNRYDGERQTKPENREKYNEIKKDFIEYYLKKWGNEYKAEFSLKENGWLETKLKPNHKQ